MFGIGIAEFILIIVILLIIFGAGNLPAISAGIGKAIKDFKHVMREDDRKGEEQIEEKKKS